MPAYNNEPPNRKVLEIDTNIIMWIPLRSDPRMIFQALLLMPMMH
jgi:hypothetical protein